VEGINKTPNSPVLAVRQDDCGLGFFELRVTDRTTLDGDAKEAKFEFYPSIFGDSPTFDFDFPDGEMFEGCA
jgi:hypothetical protein